MALSLKQRQKQELKQLNQECDVRIQGKKGAERQAEMKLIDQAKRALFEKHERELKEAEDEAAIAEQVVQAEDKTLIPSPATEPKLSKARLKQQKKEEREAEERRKREAESKAKGPTIRDMEMTALAKQLSRFGLQVHEITPDGNCLYSALQDQLRISTGDAKSTDVLRNLAADEMEANRDLFEPFLPEDEQVGGGFEVYVNKVRENGVWGGELELRALSTALQRPIWVHRVNSPIVKMGQDEFGARHQALHLTYHEHQFAMGEHYNSAVPTATTGAQEDTTTL